MYSNVLAIIVTIIGRATEYNSVTTLLLFSSPSTWMYSVV